MKILEVTDRGIILSENDEVIGQGLYKDESDLIYEIYDLLSKYETLGEVSLKIEIELDEKIILDIKDIIIAKKGYLTHGKNQKNIFKYFLIILILIQIPIGSTIIIFNYRNEKEIFNLKRKINNFKKEIQLKDQEIKLNFIEVYEEINFNKSSFSNILIFISNVSKKADVNIHILDISEENISLKGSSNKLENVFKIKKYILNYEDFKESKFDYIKKEGDLIYFLIELKKS